MIFHHLAVEAFRSRLGLYSLDLLFSQRFNQTHVFDLPLLYNNININYNIFVNLYPQTKVLDIVCGKTVSNYIVREQIDPNLIVHSDAKQIETYVKLRNIEEGLPFSPQKVKGITKKAKYLLKNLTKTAQQVTLTKSSKIRCGIKIMGTMIWLKNLRVQPEKLLKLQAHLKYHQAQVDLMDHQEDHPVAAAAVAAPVTMEDK